jgi:hypothetical protein
LRLPRAASGGSDERSILEVEKSTMQAFFLVGVSSMTFTAVFLFSGCWAEDATPWSA